MLERLLRVGPQRAAQNGAREALEAAGMGWFELDLSTRRVTMSPLGLRMCGIESDTLQVLDREKALACVHPEDVEIPRRALASAIRGDDGGRYHVAYRVVGRDGALRWVEPTGRVVFGQDATGCRRALRLVGVMADVTERRQELLGLQRITSMLETLGEATDAMLYVKDIEGRYLYCNSAALQVMGGWGADAIGKTDLEHFGPGAATEAIMEQDRAVMREGRTAFLEERLEGSDRVYLSTKTPCHDGTGKVIGVAGVSLDVTEQRRMQQALRDSEERTALALEGAQIGVYEWDPIADRLVWSDTLRRQFGVDLGAEITIQTALSRIHPEDVERVSQSIGAALDPAGPGHYDIEYRTVPVGGEVRWLHVLGRVRFEEREGRRVAVRFAGVAIDITARKALETALREAARRKDEFLAMLAHELRNPLAPLRAAAELMRRDDLERPRLHTLQKTIARQVDHMSRLVDDLLDASRVDQGKISLALAPVEMKPLLSAAVEAARSFTEPRRHRVELVLPSEPLWVEGDAVRLTQIATNLLHNAAKFSEEGGFIRVALERDGEDVLLRVADQGHGIAPALMPHIFEMFTQGDASLSREKGGLGIGLSLVRNLAMLHGGSVTGSSAGPGRGAEFVVRLPAIEPPVPVSGAASGAPAGRSRRVLLVDDNRDAADTLKMLLEMGGHDAHVAYDGAAALALVERLLPEVMVVDIGLPGMDGYEVARRMRELPAGRYPLLVALTGYASPEDRQKALDAGFDRHFAKPVEIDALLQVLQAAA